MLYIITEDSNSARDFWSYAAGVYRIPGTYFMVPLIKGRGGNTTLKEQINSIFSGLKRDDELFIVFDNIGVTKRFNSYDLIMKTSIRCANIGVRFAYTKYYCFEELYLSYNELLKLTDSKYIEALRYVNSCINHNTEYFEITRLDKRITQFIIDTGHTIRNKEYLANELLVHATQHIRGKFRIHKSGNVFDHNGKCWIHDCKYVRQSMNEYEINSVCIGHCKYSCKNGDMRSKIIHLNHNSLLDRSLADFFLCQNPANH